MELWKGNHWGQGSSNRAVTTHHRAKCEAARGRWQRRPETDAQVTQKDWVTDKKRGISWRIIARSRDRESALSDSYFMNNWTARRTKKVPSIPRERGVILLGWRHFLFSWLDTLPGTATHGDTERARCHRDPGEKRRLFLTEWKEQRNSRRCLIDGGDSIRLSDGKTMDGGTALSLHISFHATRGVRESISTELWHSPFGD